MRVGLIAACACLVGATVSGVLATDQKAVAAENQLTIVNKCTVPVWIQQDGLPGQQPVIEILPGKSQAYPIALKGVPSTRFWPKLGCDGSGNNCAVGQSSNPCPSNGGCAPPVDSKLEATWGCLTDPASCAINPSSKQPLDKNTWFNASLVDGFTLPFDVTVQSGDTSSGCQTPATCPAINYNNACPTSADLSTDGHFPAYAKENLKVIAPNGSVAGCFSPCGKLTFSKFYGGHQLLPNDPQAAFYCCAQIQGTNPLPPLDPSQPQGCTNAQNPTAPAPHTSYVDYVHKACNKSVYAFAYDDTVGLRVCQGATLLTFTLCP